MLKQINGKGVSTTLILMILYICQSTVAGEEIINVPDSDRNFPLVLNFSGEEVKALVVAYEDFKLKQLSALPDIDKWSDLSSYNVYLNRKSPESNFKVTFMAELSDFNERTTAPNEVHYEIDWQTFEIINVEFGM